MEENFAAFLFYSYCTRAFFSSFSFLIPASKPSEQTIVRAHT